jgi:hypothetical protein
MWNTVFSRSTYGFVASLNNNNKHSAKYLSVEHHIRVTYLTVWFAKLKDIVDLSSFVGFAKLKTWKTGVRVVKIVMFSRILCSLNAPPAFRRVVSVPLHQPSVGVLSTPRPSRRVSSGK